MFTRAARKKGENENIVDNHTINNQSDTDSPDDDSGDYAEDESMSSNSDSSSSDDEDTNETNLSEDSDIEISINSNSQDSSVGQVVDRQASTISYHSTPPLSQKTRKRTKNQDKWKKNKAKRLKNSGKSYRSSSGKIIASKKMGLPCTQKCRLSCSEKIPESLRTDLFKKYWASSSLQRQRDYLSSCIEHPQVKYRRVSGAHARQPNCTFKFFLDGMEIYVCKTFLVNTLGITTRTIRSVIESKYKGNGILFEDKRGKHTNHKKFDEEIRKSVEDHIKSIPRIESHYVRNDTTREFIDGGLSVADMHRNYAEQRNSIGASVASYNFYYEIFNTKFNIGFFVPRKDQCDLCEMYKNAEGNEKTELEEKYNAHMREKDLSRIEKKADREKADEKTITYAVYDLQAVLPVPMGQTSAFFYKSRLNCYNFTVSVNNNSCKRITPVMITIMITLIIMRIIFLVDH